MPVKILHLITDLSIGGAQMVLYNLLANQDQREFSSRVISMTDPGPVGEMISRLGVKVTSLGLRPGFPDPRGIFRMRDHVLAWKPQLIQTWMYHADLLGGLAALISGRPPVVWGLHHTISGSDSLKPGTRIVARLCAALSGLLPAAIICCAESTLLTHVTLGYKPSKMIVIPNGIDVNVFTPNPTARKKVRLELGIDDRSPLLGLCARFHPQKDHLNFLRAAANLSKQIPSVHFVLWGENIDGKNDILMSWIRQHSLLDRVHLLGPRNDSNQIMAALDIAGLSSSYGEAFPLVIGEAMACGIPCVATDIGDSAILVGSTGRIVPARDPVALAAAWAEILLMDKITLRKLGETARRRIETYFSITHMVQAYEQVHRKKLSREGASL